MDSKQKCSKAAQRLESKKRKIIAFLQLTEVSFTKQYQCSNDEYRVKGNFYKSYIIAQHAPPRVFILLMDYHYTVMLCVILFRDFALAHVCHVALL